VTTWLVDGTNVMGSRPDGWWRDRHAAQHRLADEVATAVADPVTLVFDGRDPGGDWPPGIEIRFAERSGPDAADDLIGNSAGVLPQVFQHHVATQAVSDQPDTFVLPGSQRMLNDPLQVFGLSDMVRTQQAVRFTAAAPKIEAQAIPALIVEIPHHTKNVVPISAALQAVQGNQQAAAAYFRPVQVQKVAVRGVDTLPFVVDAFYLAEKGRVDGVGMGVAEDAGGMVGRIWDDGHGSTFGTHLLEGGKDKGLLTKQRPKCKQDAPRTHKTFYMN